MNILTWYDENTKLDFLLDLLEDKSYNSVKYSFSLACVQQVFDLIEEPYKKAVALFDNYIHGYGQYQTLFKYYSSLGCPSHYTADYVAYRLIEVIWDTATVNTIAVESRLMQNIQNDGGYSSFACEQRELLRNLVNPFYKSSFHRSQQARNLADLIHKNKDWDTLPILADMVEEDGADSSLVGHLRYPGPHYRGWWSLDVVRFNGGDC